MTTTPQTLTLAGEDYIVIPRDEYERPRAATDEDAADLAAIRRVLAYPNETWAPPQLVRRLVEPEHPVRVCRSHRGLTAARCPPPRASRAPTSPPSSAA